MLTQLTNVPFLRDNIRVCNVKEQFVERFYVAVFLSLHFIALEAPVQIILDLAFAQFRLGQHHLLGYLLDLNALSVRQKHATLHQSLCDLFSFRIDRH